MLAGYVAKDAYSSDDSARFNNRYVPRYNAPHRNCLECHRLARWIVTFLATTDRTEIAVNATGLPGWIVTFLATTDRTEIVLNATGLPGVDRVRSLLQRTAPKLS